MSAGTTASITTTTRANTIGAVLRRSASVHGSATALLFENRTWTYRQLDDAVNRVAHQLLDLGVAPGSRVATYGKNSDAYLILFIACARAGLVHVPVNFALKGDELAYLLEDSQASMLVLDNDLMPRFTEIHDAGRASGVTTVLPMFPATATEAPEGAPEGEQDTGAASILQTALAGDASQVEVEVRGDDLAQLLYTSGTTSQPKGAMMTQEALVHQYVSCIIALDFTANDRPLIPMPLYHSAAMHVFAMPYLALGARIRLLQRPDVGEILRLVEEEKIGSLFLAPTVWVPLANHSDLETRDLSSLVKAQYGASIMPVTVLQRLRQRYPGIGFYNCFGQSEMGPLTTVLRPEEHEARPASCGRPILLVETRVVTAAGTEAGVDEPGEIQYRSPNLFTGYWNKPDATEAAFQDGWFRSGDQVTKDAEGFIQVVDRIKDIINTGGELVAPREVEDCIYELTEVAEVAVIGVPDERWIEAVTAVVVLKPGTTLSTDDVTGHVKSRIAGFKVPKHVSFVDELPRNQSGKLLKRVMREEYVTPTV